MKRLLALAAALAVLVLAAGPRAASAAGADPALLAAMDQLNKAFETEDRAAIERLVTPDHKAVGPIYPGAVDLARQFALFPEVHYSATLVSGPMVEMLSPDAALVNLELAIDGSFRGQALPKRSYVTAIWVRVGGRWLQKLYQETAVRAD
jgi:hypothetical protein